MPKSLETRPSSVLARQFSSVLCLNRGRGRWGERERVQSEIELVKQFFTKLFSIETETFSRNILVLNKFVSGKFLQTKMVFLTENKQERSSWTRQQVSDQVTHLRCGRPKQALETGSSISPVSALSTRLYRLLLDLVLSVFPLKFLNVLILFCFGMKTSFKT